MKKADILYNNNFLISCVEPTLFGSFVEHLGRCMYRGIYEPEHSQADENGFREDVKMLIAELGVTAIRYPGGNFVSGYNWKDGIGPKEKRPIRKELAWGGLETNQVGMDEFLPLLKEMKIEPLLAVNMGTGTLTEARELVEYCNGRHTTWAKIRKENGHEEPYKVRYFCLGNEMDGEWQIGMHTPEEYARKLKETAKIVKWAEPEAKIIACGSCTNEIGHVTFGEWDNIILDEAYDYIDYLSIHRYYNYHPEKDQVYERGNTLEDAPYFFSNMQSYINTIKGVCDFIKGKKHSKKTISISFDEWGLVTLSAADPGVVRQEFGFAQYSQYDAAIYGGFLCILLNNCDRVKIACQSLLINEGGMISTDSAGKAIRQSVFYPFMQVAKYARGGYVLTPSVHAMPQVETVHYGFQDSLQVACVWQQEKREIIIFASNVDQKSSIELNVDLTCFNKVAAIERLEIYTEDMNEVNTFSDEFRVVPHIVPLDDPKNGKVKEVLRPHSWNVLRYGI